MAIENKEPRTIKPTHPGEMLREDFLPDYGLTTAGLAEALGVSRQTINEVLREKRAISPVMALRLARLFGSTPEFWLNTQRAYDLWQAKRDNQQKSKRSSHCTQYESSSSCRYAYRMSNCVGLRPSERNRHEREVGKTENREKSKVHG